MKSNRGLKNLISLPDDVTLAKVLLTLLRDARDARDAKEIASSRSLSSPRLC